MNNKEIELIPITGPSCWNTCPMPNGINIPPNDIKINNIVYALEECDLG